MADNQPNNGGAVQPGTAEIKPQDQKTEAPSKPAEVKITSDDIEFKSLDIMQELGYSSRAKKKPEESEQKKEEKKKINLDCASQGVGIKGVSGFDFLQKNPEDIFNETNTINGDTVKGKWTKAVLDKNEVNLLNEIIKHPNVHSFDTIANVEVGMVTGANEFFLVNKDVVDAFDLSEFTHPMFGRSQHCQGVIYDEVQHLANIENKLPVYFLYFDNNLIKKQTYYYSLFL